MVKRTLYFGSSAYLSLRNQQLVISLPHANGLEKHTSGADTIPVEDIGMIVLDEQQITISQGLMAALLANNVAVITCNQSHHPTGMMLPLDGNNTQSRSFRFQIEASEPLRKQLWQQTVQAKIMNQAYILGGENPDKRLLYLAQNVKSGDPENTEAQAAVYYWQRVFPESLQFRRNREGQAPNNLLNYGYAILRAITARALVCSGLLPTFGIHHRNQYNAYCLADDIMEPYRPFVDAMVIDMVKTENDYETLSKALKTRLLSIPTIDVTIKNERSPLMVAMSITTASLQRCFEGKTRKIIYPNFTL
jgi:CRISP-associated protein Cas1